MSDAATNMLQDVVFEMNDLLEDSAAKSSEYRAGMFRAVAILYRQLDTFGIDQTNWSRPLMNPEIWYLSEFK